MKSPLVLGRAPATVDDELDPVARGIRSGLAQRTEENWIELRYTRNVVIEDCRAVRDGTVSLATRITTKVTALAERNADG